MTIESLIAPLQLHAKNFPPEREYCEKTISWIQDFQESAFTKSNLAGHITASLLIMNIERTKVLLMFHKKLQFWVQFGGHCDGEADTLAVAIREFHEESGIDVEPTIVNRIFDVHVHDIPMDKRGTPPHLHHDILYLASISDYTPYVRQESEVDDIRWFHIEGIEKYIAEPRMLYMIEKIKNLKNV